MNKAIYAILFVTSLSLLSDFIALRKLKHPVTAKTVYILYDMHKTVVPDKFIPEVQAFKKSVAEHIESASESLKDIYPYLDEQAVRMHQYMPQLMQQHFDLISLLKDYNIALINEDWPTLSALKIHEISYINSRLRNKYFIYFEQIAGESKLVSSKRLLREKVSPLQGIGKAVTGEFSMGKFIPVGSAYFYNPDERHSQVTSDEAGFKVDQVILKAIQQIFVAYKQQYVIVAVGAAHGREVAQELVAQGYMASSPVTSAYLSEQRKKNPLLEDAFQNYVIVQHPDKERRKQFYTNLEVDYSLVYEPLNFKDYILNDIACDALLQLQKGLMILAW